MNLVNFYEDKTFDELELFKKAGFFKDIYCVRGDYLKEPLVKISLQISNKEARLSLLRNAHLICFYTFNPNKYKPGYIYKTTWKIYKTLDKEYKALKRVSNTPIHSYWFASESEFTSYIQCLDKSQEITIKFNNFGTFRDATYKTTIEGLNFHFHDGEKYLLYGVDAIMIDFIDRKVILHLNIPWDWILNSY